MTWVPRLYVYYQSWTRMNVERCTWKKYPHIYLCMFGYLHHVSMSNANMCAVDVDLQISRRHFWMRRCRTPINNDNVTHELKKKSRKEQENVKKTIFSKRFIFLDSACMLMCVHLRACVCMRVYAYMRVNTCIAFYEFIFII